MTVAGELAHIYDDTGQEDVVPADQLKAAASIEDNKKLVEECQAGLEGLPQ